MANMFYSPVGFKASTVSISQEIIIKAAALSNGNVRIQMLTMPHKADPAGAAYNARFFCEKCKATDAVEMERLFNEDALLASLVEWCKVHRHDPPAPIPVPERKVQDADERRLKVIL